MARAACNRLIGRRRVQESLIALLLTRRPGNLCSLLISVIRNALVRRVPRVCIGQPGCRPVGSIEVSSVATVKGVTEPTSSWDPYAHGCPSRDLLDRIGDRWTVLVLGELGKNGVCRYTRLRKRLSGVSEKMLTQTLRALERDGLVR